MLTTLQGLLHPRFLLKDGSTIGPGPTFSPYVQKAAAKVIEDIKDDKKVDNPQALKELQAGVQGYVDNLKTLGKAPSPEITKAKEILDAVLVSKTVTPEQVETLQKLATTIQGNLTTALPKGTNLVKAGEKIEVKGVSQAPTVESFITNHSQAANRLAIAQDPALKARIRNGEDDAKGQLAMQVAIAEYGNNMQLGAPRAGGTNSPEYKAATEARFPGKNTFETYMLKEEDKASLMSENRQTAIAALVKTIRVAHPLPVTDAQVLAMANKLKDDYDKATENKTFPTQEAKDLKNEIASFFAAKNPDGSENKKFIGVEGIPFSVDKARILMDPHKDPAQAIVDLAKLIKLDKPDMSMKDCLKVATEIRAKVDDYSQTRIEAKATEMYTKELGGNTEVFSVRTQAVGNMSRSSGLTLTEADRQERRGYPPADFVGLFNNEYKNGTIRMKEGTDEVELKATQSFSADKGKELQQKLNAIIKDKVATNPEGKDLAAALAAYEAADTAARVQGAPPSAVDKARTALKQLESVLAKIETGFPPGIGELAKEVVTTRLDPSFVTGTGTGTAIPFYSSTTEAKKLNPEVQTSMTLKPMGVDFDRTKSADIRPTVKINVEGAAPIVIKYHKDEVTKQIVAAVDSPKTLPLPGGITFNPGTGVLDFGEQMKGKSYTIETSVKAMNVYGDSDDFAVVMTETMTPKFTASAVDVFAQDRISVKPGMKILTDKEIDAVAGVLRNGGTVAFTELVGEGVNAKKQAPEKYDQMRLSKVDVDTSTKDIKIKIQSSTDPVRSQYYSNTDKDPDGNIGLSQDRSVASALNIVGELKKRFPVPPEAGTPTEPKELATNVAIRKQLEGVDADSKEKLINPQLLEK